MVAEVIQQLLNSVLVFFDNNSVIGAQNSVKASRRNNCTRQIDFHRNATMTHETHFEFSSTVNELLFERIKISSAGGVFAACVLFMMVAVSYEGIRLLRKYLMLRSGEDDRRSSSRDESTPLQTSSTEKCLNCSFDNWSQSVLHMAQMFVGYILMLAVMTYNAWILLAVLLGAGLGAYTLGGNWSFKRTAQFEVRVSASSSRSMAHSSTPSATDIQIGHQNRDHLQQQQST